MTFNNIIAASSINSKSQTRVLKKPFFIQRFKNILINFKNISLYRIDTSIQEMYEKPRAYVIEIKIKRPIERYEIFACIIIQKF